MSFYHWITSRKILHFSPEFARFLHFLIGLADTLCRLTEIENQGRHEKHHYFELIETIHIWPIEDFVTIV